MTEKREVYCKDSNRIGKFRILHELLQDGRETPRLSAIFSLCVMFDDETHEDETGRGLMFYAASDLFQPIAEGSEIPEYRIECAWPGQAFQNPEHETQCMRAGPFRVIAVRQIVIRAPAINFAFKTVLPGKIH